MKNLIKLQGSAERVILAEEIRNIRIEEAKKNKDIMNIINTVEDAEFYIVTKEIHWSNFYNLGTF